MKYQWILFDADNTLFDFTYSQRMALMETCLSFSVPYNSDIFSKFVEVNNVIWQAYDENKITHEEIKLERFRRLFEITNTSNVSLKDFNIFYIDKLIEHSKLIEGTEEFLYKIFGKVKIAIITNGMKEVQRPRFENWTLNSNIDQIFISGEIGYSKPNKEYFELVHQKTGNHSKADYLVVGDNILADIKGGKDYGFDTCWLNSTINKNGYSHYADFNIKSINELCEIII